MACEENIIDGCLILDTVKNMNGGATIAMIIKAVADMLKKQTEIIESDVTEIVEAGVRYGYLKRDESSGKIFDRKPKDRGRRRTSSRGRTSHSRHRSRRRYNRSSRSLSKSGSRKAKWRRKH